MPIDAGCYEYRVIFEDRRDAVVVVANNYKSAVFAARAELGIIGECLDAVLVERGKGASSYIRPVAGPRSTWR
ncbi:MAG: hypothetical protein ACXVZJ_07540 [Terriglobales bacterium]